MNDLLHHVGPVAVLNGGDHLVDVQQGDVVVSRIENNNQAESSCDSGIVCGLLYASVMLLEPVSGFLAHMLPVTMRTLPDQTVFTILMKVR